MVARHDETLAPAERARRGAHYTPADLAKTIVARALQPLLEWPEAVRCPACLPSSCLLDLLVIDLACGDGVFLSAAADILGELLWEAYQCEGVECDRAEARVCIEQNVLLGVDIDPGAIAAARLALPDTEFQCADALFDFNFDTDGRPTAFVGNPPYLGGGKISGTLGREYQKRLMREFTPAHGNADLCAYFLLAAAQLLDDGKSKGTISYICTNTISQGDTRRAGLAWLLNEHRDTIYCADRNVLWPGKAKVVCSIVHLANEELWTAISTGTASTQSTNSKPSAESAHYLQLTPRESATKTAGDSGCSNSENNERTHGATTTVQQQLDFGLILPSVQRHPGRGQRPGKTVNTRTCAASSAHRN